MDFLHEIINSNLFVMNVLGIILQVIGTTLLALFSFKGIVISSSNNVYANGKALTRVEFDPRWILVGRFALIFLLIGIVISGINSLASFC